MKKAIFILQIAAPSIKGGSPLFFHMVYTILCFLLGEICSNVLIFLLGPLDLTCEGKLLVAKTIHTVSPIGEENTKKVTITGQFSPPTSCFGNVGDCVELSI